MRAITPPAYRGVSQSIQPSLNLEGEQTDIDNIIFMAHNVEQKDGPKAESAPDLPVTEAVVTAVDGHLTEAGEAAAPSSSTKRSLRRRDANDYNLVFSGTGTNAADRDAYVQGTAYLTYHLVNNATYNVEACLDHCSSEPRCGKWFAILIFWFFLIDDHSLRQLVLRVQQRGHRQRRHQSQVCPLR